MTHQFFASEEDLKEFCETLVTQQGLFLSGVTNAWSLEVLKDSFLDPRYHSIYICDEPVSSDFKGWSEVQAYMVSYQRMVLPKSRSDRILETFISEAKGSITKSEIKKKVAKVLRSMSTSGMIAVSEKTGKEVPMKKFRYFEGAKKAYENGMLLSQNATSCTFFKPA